MKKLITPLIVLSLLIPLEKAEALFGIGIKGIGDTFTVDGWNDGTSLYSLQSPGFKGSEGVGVGGFIYIDVLPFIDLEASIEFAPVSYNLEFANVITSLPTTQFGWTRVSTYFTARKKMVGLGIPFLGGGSIHLGGGVNSHMSSKRADLDMMSDLLGGDLANGGSGINLEDKVKDFVTNRDNWLDNSGLHIQASMQAKLLTFSSFLTYRITLAEGVVPGSDSFSTLWAGLAFGF